MSVLHRPEKARNRYGAWAPLLGAALLGVALLSALAWQRGPEPAPPAPTPLERPYTGERSEPHVLSAEQPSLLSAEARPSPPPSPRPHTTPTPEAIFFADPDRPPLKDGALSEPMPPDTSPRRDPFEAEFIASGNIELGPRAWMAELPEPSQRQIDETIERTEFEVKRALDERALKAQLRDHVRDEARRAALDCLHHVLPPRGARLQVKLERVRLFEGRGAIHGVHVVATLEAGSQDTARCVERRLEGAAIALPFGDVSLDGLLLGLEL